MMNLKYKALQKYSFPQLKTWFLDRGHLISKKWLNDWFVYKDLLYYHPTEQAPIWFQGESDWQCVYFCLESSHFEPQDFITLEEYNTKKESI